MKPHKFSPSQIKAWRRCKRVWAFDKVMGIRAPTKPSAALGSRVHGILERYYLGGLPPDPKTREGKIGSFALAHYPDPHPGMRVEEHFDFEFGGLLWHGKRDLDWDPEVVPTDRVFTFPADIDHVIADHKTSADPSVWGETVESLPDDEQFVIYAWSIFDEVLEIEKIAAQWTYMKTRGKGHGLPIRGIAEREETRKKMLPIVETGREMLDVLSSGLRDANQLEPTTTACGDFGGCEYAKMGVCVLSMDDRLDAAWAKDEQRRERA